MIDHVLDYIKKKKNHYFIFYHDIISLILGEKNMKKFALFCGLLSCCDAKWEGFFVRGGASVFRATSKTSSSYLTGTLGLGYGTLLKGMLYQGLYLGAELHPLSGTVVFTKDQDEVSSYSPHVSLRVGAPIKNCMPYTGLVFQYQAQNEHVFMAGIRLGVDFELIHPRFLGGIAATLMLPFTKDEHYTATFTTGFSVGVQF